MSKVTSVTPGSQTEHSPASRRQHPMPRCQRDRGSVIQNSPFRPKHAFGR